MKDNLNMSTGIRNIQISPGGNTIAVGIAKFNGLVDLTNAAILYVGAND